MMRGFFCAVICAILIASTVPDMTIKAEGNETSVNDAVQELTLYSKAAVLMDAESGRVLYGKNETEFLPMASTTKIMSCIIILENTKPDELLTVSSYAASMPKVKLYLKRNEQYRVEDLLYSMMLESHNDSAAALAEYVGSKLEHFDEVMSDVEKSKKYVAAFARAMNRKAVEIGCEDTWFITPNGLDASQEIIMPEGEIIQKTHGTTAEELGKILSYCILKSPQKEKFLQICRKRNYSFQCNNRYYNLINHNAYLDYEPDAICGKTGFTNLAGYCYVGAVKSQGRVFVAALLGCGWPNNKSYKWKDMKKLIQYGTNNFGRVEFKEELASKMDIVLEPIIVQSAQTHRLNEEKTVKVTIREKEGEEAESVLLRKGEQIQIEINKKNYLTAPVAKGDTVGTVVICIDDMPYKYYEIVSAEEIEGINFEWCIWKIWGYYHMKIQNMTIF